MAECLTVGSYVYRWLVMVVQLLQPDEQTTDVVVVAVDAVLVHLHAGDHVVHDDDHIRLVLDLDQQVAVHLLVEANFHGVQLDESQRAVVKVAMV